MWKYGPAKTCVLLRHRPNLIGRPKLCANSSHKVDMDLRRLKWLFNNHCTAALVLTYCIMVHKPSNNVLLQ